MAGGPLEIIYEDADLIAASKPSGLLTEGGGSREDDLEQVVTRHLRRQARCCHRLDRLTSGVVLLRKNARFNAALTASFAERSVRKEYWALVEGVWDRRVTRVESKIGPLGGGLWANVDSGGKPALSTFQTLGIHSDAPVSWLSILLKTGRTHQARLHCQLAGHPILGDLVYGGPPTEGSLFGLHARNLRILHPGTGKALDLMAEPPQDWQALANGFPRGLTR